PPPPRAATFPPADSLHVTAPPRSRAAATPEDQNGNATRTPAAGAPPRRAAPAARRPAGASGPAPAGEHRRGAAEEGPDAGRLPALVARDGGGALAGRALDDLRVRAERGRRHVPRARAGRRARPH